MLRAYRWLVPTHLQYRNWHFFAKFLNVSGLIFFLNYVGPWFGIPAHFTFATAVAVVMIASGVGEFSHHQRADWRGIAYIIAAVVAFVYIYHAGNEVLVSDSGYESELARHRTITIVVLWLVADGILAPDRQDSQEKSSS